MGGSELSVRHFSAVGGGAAFPPLLSVVLWGRRMGRRGRHCTWWPRRPGTLPCLPLHVRTRLRGPGGSPSGAGGRARCDSARLAMTRFCHFFRRTQFFFKSFCSGLFREGLRRAPFSVAAAYIVLPPSFHSCVSVEEGLASGGGRLWDSWACPFPRPSPRAEIVLEASGARRPALVPGCWGEGRLRGGAPSSRGRRMSSRDESRPRRLRPPS